MNRKELLNKINTIIIEEQGVMVTESSLVTEAKLDSFGYLVLWVSVEDYTNVNIPVDVINNVDYTVFTIRDMIDIVDRSIHD